MPIFRYKCDLCEREMDVLHIPGETLDVKDDEECPQCVRDGEEYPGALYRVPTAPSFLKVKGYSAQNGYSVTYE